jgi:hypothetical protein
VRDAENPSLSKLGYAVVVVLCGITWMLSHSYRDIFHDASLYTLQALAHLRPASLGQDVFLQFGSQDRFTLFGPLYAGVIRMLGPAVAAALLTLTQQLALFACAWILARTVMPAPWALLGAAVFIAIPGDYGADRVFTCVEQFLTPRMGAEALALGSVAAALCSRRWLALILLIAAALLHPIMAAAGAVALLCLYLAIPYPRRSLAIAAAAAALLVLVAYAMPQGRWGRFDDAWMTLVMNRSPYLFLAHWQLDDWGRVAVTLTTLLVGHAVLAGGRAHSLCQAALLTAISGLTLTLLACDLLHLVVMTQLQPWRWLWLGVAASALLLPLILRACWQAGIGRRTTAMLLTAAWIFAQGAFALAVALAAVASLALLRRLKPSEARWVLWGACGILVIALAWRLATNLQFTDAYYLDTRIPLWLRRAMSFAHDGGAPLAVIAVAWWLADTARPVGLTVLAAIALLGGALLLPQTWNRWTALGYSPQRIEQFAPWRDRLPRGAQVLWPESPLATWLLLDRPNYLSLIQTSGMVFSRDAALEMQRRALALSPAIEPKSFLSWDASMRLGLSAQQALQACQTVAFQFLVTTTDLGIAPLDVLQGVRLYRCAA